MSRNTAQIMEDKIMKKFLSMALALTMMVSLAACGAKEEAAPAASAPAASAEKALVYAVEAGSAG